MKKDTIKLIVIVVIASLIGGYVGGLVGDKAALGGTTNYDALDVTDGYSVDGTTVIDGDGNIDAPITSTTGTFSSTINYLESNEAVSADNTLTISESGKTTYITTTGATSTLPAVASSAGAVFRFVVGAAFDTNNAVIASAEGDNIEGSLIVAGAVVDCDAEDRISFVADGENLGDFVEVRSNGTNWFVTQSNALTTAKLTCDDPS